jgi:hypothetical protein
MVMKLFKTGAWNLGFLKSCLVESAFVACLLPVAQAKRFGKLQGTFKKNLKF